MSYLKEKRVNESIYNIYWINWRKMRFVKRSDIIYIMYYKRK
jgi:hypothetical protein